MMTDDEIIAIAKATETAEPGTDGYILPVSFARAIIAVHTAKVLDDMEPVAHVYPSTLEKFQEREAFDHCYSIKVGCPDETSVGLYAADQLAAAITTRDRRIEELENECKAWALTVDNLESKLCPTAPPTAT